MEEKLKTLQDCAEFLNGMGFEESPFAYDYLNDELVSYTMKNKNNVNVVITCHPSNKWDEVVNNLNDDEEIEIDFNEHIVDYIIVRGIVCTEENYLTGNKEGIVLNANAKEDSYHCHQITANALKTAILAQEKPSEHMIGILRSHIRHVETLKTNLFPILEKYDFVETYNSVLDITGNDRNTSDVYSVFEHPNDFGHLSISVATDCLTGELVVSGFEDVDFYKATKEDIDKLFVERILTDKETNEPMLIFAYLLDDDEKHTIKTYGEVSQCLAISREPLYYTMRHIDEINTDAIPEKYMHYYNEAKEAVLNILNKPKK